MDNYVLVTTSLARILGRKKQKKRKKLLRMERTT